MTVLKVKKKLQGDASDAFQDQSHSQDDVNKCKKKMEILALMVNIRSNYLHAESIY